MKKKIALLARSLHPAHARKLSERLLSQTFSFYFSYVAIGLILMMAIFAGLNWNKPFDIDELSANQSITLVDRPLVTLDPTLNETHSFIAFSNEEMSYKKFIFFGRSTTPYVNQLTLLLLPGIILLIGIITLLFGLVIALLTSTIGYFFIQKKEVTYRDIFAINLQYQAPLMFFFFILFPFWNWAFLLFIIYFFNFFIGVILLRNKKFKSMDV